jgi:hypothetical protein
MKILQKSVLESEREIPIADMANVVVAGGGVAGIAAAVAAARNSARTVLVERNGFLGGTATAAMMGKLVSTHLATGFAEEMIKELLDRGGTSEYSDGKPDSIAFDLEVYKEVVLYKLEQAGVQMYFYTYIAAPIVLHDGEVQGIIVENKSGRSAILADVVVDATGDADLAAAAGAPFVKGRESDGKMRPVALLFEIGGIDFNRLREYEKSHPDQIQPIHFDSVTKDGKIAVRISGFYDLVSKAREKGELDKDCYYLRLEDCWLERGSALVNTTRVYNIDGTDAKSLSRAEVETRKQVRQIIRFLRRYVPGCESVYLIQTASNLGVRESRRITGRHVLTTDEVLTGKAFEDSVFIAEHKIPKLAKGQVEIHNPDGKEGSAADIGERNPAGIPMLETILHFPYRALIPQRVERLLVAGRTVSVDHTLDLFTRLMVICMLTGQIAGIAAAQASRQGILPSALSIDPLKGELAKQNVRLRL